MKHAFRLGALLGLGLAALTIAAGHAEDAKRIGISTIVEVPQLVETKDGVLAALAERGFVVGKNLSVDYQSANGNAPTQQQIAKKFVGDKVDLIVAITTPTAQAMAAATSDIPIVFTAVTDPVKAKLIEQFAKPGHNITGVSDAAPIAEQLKLFREIKPAIKTLGFVYNPGLDSSKASLGWMKEAATAQGVNVVESTAPTTNEVIPAVRKLIGSVDAIYIPNDTTVVAALESVVKIGEETSTPVFTGETRGVERGALASLGLNYTDVGRFTGNMVADILSGKSKVGETDAVLAYKVLPKFAIVINEGAAGRMNTPLPASVVSKATKAVK